MLFWLFAVTSWDASFFAIGIGPVALVLAVIWIRHGFEYDRKAREKATNDAKQRITCPKCPQVWHRAPGQIDFKCSRCGTAFKYCPHCGSTYGAA